MGIPGAPEVSSRVCHSATDGSIVKIDALNEVNAVVGDWVSVTQRDDILKKNLAVILGIPLLGGILGLIAALLVSRGIGMPHPFVWGALVGIGALMGIVVSRRIYGVLSVDNDLFIRQVIKSAGEVANQFGDVRAKMENAAAACGDCTQCLPRGMRERVR
jgi:hypothetical protein